MIIFILNIIITGINYLIAETMLMGILFVCNIAFCFFLFWAYVFEYNKENI